MKAETLLSLPPGIAITDDFVSVGALHLVVASTRTLANCPLCQTPSSAQHSHSQRTIRDMPCGGYPLRIHLQTRQFFCRQPDCPRRIFTERFASFLLPRARMTERFRVALLALSAAAAHEAAYRLACRLHLPASVTTLRRQLDQHQVPSGPEPTKIGLDDFAFRKGKTYGTVIVDLESHQMVDLLEDRRCATVAAWLRRHPQLRVCDESRSSQRLRPGSGAGGSSSSANCRPLSFTGEC